jgi:hypothetical protein
MPRSEAPPQRLEKPWNDRRDELLHEKQVSKKDANIRIGLKLWEVR